MAHPLSYRFARHLLGYDQTPPPWAPRPPRSVPPPRKETIRDLLVHLLYERQDGVCPYCGRVMTWVPEWASARLRRTHHPVVVEIRSREATLDHVYPRIWGGQYEVANVVAACRSCNSSKGDRIVPPGFRREVG